MTTMTVNKQIKTAMRDAFITTAEAKSIVKEAEKHGVTAGEAKAVVSLWEKQPTPTPPGMMHTMAIPSSPGDVIFEQGAMKAMEAFFKRNNVPAGKTLKKFVDAVQKSLDKNGYGERLHEAPAHLDRLQMVRM